jgi:hypothetical protein
MEGDALKVLVIVVWAIALIGSSLACGQSATQATESVAIDRVVPRLPSGLSIGEVEERIGAPRTRFENEDGEIVLNYSPWLLVFAPSLFKRTRFYPRADWPADRPVDPLDHQIGALKLGMSRRAVERDIGKTEGWQILTFGSNERIWYGNGRWKLIFKDRRLSGKVLYGSSNSTDAPPTR